MVSFELMLPQVRDMSKAVDSELLVYGRLPLMLMENCLLKSRTGTCSCDSPTKLIDRMGEEFPLLKDPGTCRNVMYNGKRLYLLDKRKSLQNLGLWALRMSFTTENPAEVERRPESILRRRGLRPRHLHPRPLRPGRGVGAANRSTAPVGAD